MKRPPCIKSDFSLKHALCGRPDDAQERKPFAGPHLWFYAADSQGTPTCPECLSILKNAVEESERLALPQRW